MALERFVIITEDNITNNCPECFNQDLSISFYQKHSYGKLVHKITNEITHKIVCNTCKSTVHPVNWTQDIERSFEYYQKKLVPKKTTTKFTSLFYILLCSFLAIGITLLVLLLQGIIVI